MTDIRGARIVQMLQDPELGGDLLLVGLVLAARLDFDLAPATNMAEIGALAFGKSKRWSTQQARSVLKDDIRRYRRPQSSWEDRCDATMIRRDGPCGKMASSAYQGWLTDWSTGESTLHRACSRHRDWWRKEQLRNRAAKPDIVPLPNANHGGVLRKHLPEFGWTKLWKKLDPKWVEHPEVTPWPKPTLSLVLGDAEDTDGARPLLTTIHGGWES